MNYEAICYYWQNLETQEIVYVGYHKTDDEDGDYYTASTENPAFHDLWNKGLLKRVVFFKGTVEQCVSFEHYILSKMNAKHNTIMFNESNGGGAGCNLVLVNDLMKIQADKVISGQFKNCIIHHSELEKVIQAKEILEKVKTNNMFNYFQTAEVYVGELRNMQRIQIRHQRRLQNHINMIADRMADPAEARKHVKPVIVVVCRNNVKKILNGNHTLEAAIKAKWTTLPVMYIPSEEFNDDFSTMEHFGKTINIVPEVREGNSKEDVKRTILSLKEKGISFYSDEMKLILQNLYSQEYSSSSISGLIAAVRKQHFLEQEGSKYNFYNYDKGELDSRVDDYLTANPNSGCISQSAERVIFAGIGGVVNSLRQRSRDWNNPKGKIFIHYSNIKDWRDRATINRAIEDCLEIAKLNWIELEYLPCFYDTEKDTLTHEPPVASEAA